MPSILKTKKNLNLTKILITLIKATKEHFPPFSNILKNYMTMENTELRK